LHARAFPRVQAPPYLQQIEKQIANEYSYVRSMQQVNVKTGEAGMRQLEDEERLGLADKLKAKWDRVNAQYQRMCVLSLASLDTIGKIKRKDHYEAQLAQIEQNIEKLSRPVVYVSLNGEKVL